MEGLFIGFTAHHLETAADDGRRRHPDLPGRQEGIRTGAAAAHRLRHHPGQHPLLLGPRPGRGRPAGRRGALAVLPRRHPDRDLPAADLHRHRRHDRLQPPVPQAHAAALRRRRPVRHLLHHDGRHPVRLQPEGGRRHRHHRLGRRPDLHLRGQPLRPQPAGPHLGGGLFLHGAGADHPAAGDQAADQPPRAADPHGRQPEEQYRGPP